MNLSLNNKAFLTTILMVLTMQAIGGSEKHMHSNLKSDETKSNPKIILSDH